jgi:hypothetical protein
MLAHQHIDVSVGENLLHKQPSLYGVTIPTGLKDGEYLLRHEVRRICFVESALSHGSL